MNETLFHVKQPTILTSLLHRERSRLFRPPLSPRYAHRELNSAVRGSTQLVERMKLFDKLSKHNGCVNSVLFSNCGDYIYTGSDDTHVHIYNTHSRRLLLDLPTAHVENIFFAKELSSSMPDWVLTCAADGQVLLTHAPTRMRKRVFHHEGRAHRIAHWPQSESSFFTCGEDGACFLFDLRDHVRSDGTCADYDGCLPKVCIHFANGYGDSQSIFSIGVNPSNPNEIALAGESNAVSLYDIRKTYRPTGFLCPDSYQLSDESDTHITGIKYSPDGELLFASYSEGDVYSFLLKEHTRANTSGCQCEQEEPQEEESDDDESCPPLEGEEEEGEEDEDEESQEQDDVDDEEESERSSQSSSNTGRSSHSSSSTSRGYYQRYQGHRNADTVKQVGCYGSRGEFVVSGSDCGHIFIWDTHSARLVKMLEADSIGAVNCISAHPTMPMLATSGLERDAKLWLPIGAHLPLVAGSKELEKAEQVMHDNTTRPSRSSMMNQAMLRQLMMMLAGASSGRFAVPFPEDDSEGDEDEEERGFGENSSSENSSDESENEDDDHYDDGGDDDGDEGDDDDDDEEEEVDFRGQRRTRDDDHESPHRPSRRRRSEGSAQPSPSSVPVPLIGVVARRRSSSESEDEDEDDMPPLEWSGDEENESDED